MELTKPELEETTDNGTIAVFCFLFFLPKQHLFLRAAIKLQCDESDVLSDTDAVVVYVEVLSSSNIEDLNLRSS